MSEDTNNLYFKEKALSDHQYTFCDYILLHYYAFCTMGVITDTFELWPTVIVGGTHPTQRVADVPTQKRAVRFLTSCKRDANIVGRSSSLLAS